jgi:hypothetical protein
LTISFLELHASNFASSQHGDQLIFLSIITTCIYEIPSIACIAAKKKGCAIVVNAVLLVMNCDLAMLVAIVLHRLASWSLSAHKNLEVSL